MDEDGGAGVGMALEDVEPRGQGSERQVQIYKEKERLKTMAKKKSQRVSKDQKQDKMFVSITEASEMTGLSAYFLRHGIKDGTVPYIMTGRKYLINMPAFKRQYEML